MNQQGSNGRLELVAWQPMKLFRTSSPFEVRYSKGFLRCSPEKWFPSFSMQWLPLFCSLGVDVSFVSAEPYIAGIHSCKYNYLSNVDGEDICISFDDSSVETIFEQIVPRGKNCAKKIVLEYIAMRLITSLSLTWSGPESSAVTFEQDSKADDFIENGGVKLQFSINGSPVIIWIKLCKKIIEKMDGLWRRQLHSTTSFNVKSQNSVRVEIAHLTLPPAMLSSYLKPGSLYDLEVTVSDSVNLIVNGKNTLSGKLGVVDGNFFVEVVSKMKPLQNVPAGTTKLSFELGTKNLEFGSLPEVTQVGALLDTGIPVTDNVFMMVNNEQVGMAQLCIYQGNLVVKVV